ncbi:MAG: phosphoribosylglycinamide formyltransferase [Candidatus Peregrinibacteria bacterium]
MKIAFFASTRGTNLQSFIDAKAAGKMPKVDVACLVTDKADCGAVEKANTAGILVHAIDPKGKTREQFDREAMAILEQYGVDLIVLGGYMRIIGAEMVQRYKNRILNVHPSLLPKFGGGMDADVHKAVLDAGEKETGMTIHLVTEQLDAGPIVLQKKVAVDSSDTPETLRAKVQSLEKEWYPWEVEQIAEGKIRLI